MSRGLVSQELERTIGRELQRRRVVVWYDAARSWAPWWEQALGVTALPGELTSREVALANVQTRVLVFGGSYYEVLEAAESLTTGSAPKAPVLIYVPGESPNEALSPLRELECLSGDREPFVRDLAQVSRQAFLAAGLSDAEIDPVLNRPNLTLGYLDAVVPTSGGHASPLAPIFQSGRELDVLPAFLANEDSRSKVAQQGLLPEVRVLVERGLGVQLRANEDVKAFAEELARAVLIGELRGDLSGPEPLAISRVPKPPRPEHLELARKLCDRLRAQYPEEYESLADGIERSLGLATAGVDPLHLGRIDTFRFEERSLLQSCDGLLAGGQAERARELVDGRMSSFWTSVARFPERRAAWRACGTLADLALAVAQVGSALTSVSKSPKEWVQRYASPDGWHRMDQLFRQARYLLSRLEDGAELERAAEAVFSRYDQLLEKLAHGFMSALAGSAWQVPEALHQTVIFEKRARPAGQGVAYILTDALRFEMGAELAQLLQAAGATALRLEPAIASTPTITEVGMAALLPGAERSFSIAETAKGVSGAIDGRALTGSSARMDHAKGQVPGLVEMTLDAVHDTKRNKLADLVKDAPLVIVRSQEIDGAGEKLPNHLAQKVMGTVLEDLRKAVIRLADAGVRRFVITADHGHLFAGRRGDDMKIDPPEGGTCVDIHRRCWVGRGGDTPSACVRIAVRDLGHSADLDLVVPRGLGVFKAGGDLVFHHGGLSLQELVVPVLTFEMPERTAAQRKSAAASLSFPVVPRSITNRIFSVTVAPVQLGLPGSELRVRLLAVEPTEGRTVGQAIAATEGWDASARVLTLSGKDVYVAIQLDDDAITELRVVAVEVGTDRTLHDTQPIPVKLLR